MAIVTEAGDTDAGDPPRLLCLEHLTLIDVPPPEFIELAHGAGFAAVGLRLRGGGGSPGYPMPAGSALLKETESRLGASGIEVLDIETLAPTAATTPDDYLPTLETGAQLGARYLNVVGKDPDLSRFTAAFARVVDECRPFGIQPVLEPMAFMEVRTLVTALEIVKQVEGGAVMIDTLHFARCGERLETIDSIPASLLPYVQIADGPLEPPNWRDVADLDASPSPSDDPLSVEANHGRSIPGDGELPISSVLARVDPATPVALEAPAPLRRRNMADEDFAKLALKRLKEAVGGAPSRF